MKIAAIFLVLVLAACGSRGALQPRAGQAAPPAPRWAAEPPTPEQMLKPPPQAAPVRVDDLIRRPEQERPGDPFDLPPQ